MFFHRSIPAATLLAAVAAVGLSAQAPVDVPQSGRLGRPKGLPRDGASLYLPDSAYPRITEPEASAVYHDIDGARAKQVTDRISAISRRSRDDGNQFWGRITGTRYDAMTRDLMEAQFREIGLKDVHQQPLAMPPLWYPGAWSASAVADGRPLALTSVFPIVDTVGTPKAGTSADAVWVGLGTDADFLGRDVQGKAVFLYSIATPGGRAHSADWNGAMQRANRAGAAMVFVVMGFPGNAVTEPEGGATIVPTFTVSSDEGDAVRAALGAGKRVTVRLAADIGERSGLKTANVWATLPGATDETIVVMAHTDSFFEGAMDNASGLAMMLELARHYAAIPQSRRRRTMVFLTTPDHHQGFVGIKWVHDHFDFSKTAVIVNCEHPSQTLLYLLGSGIMTANAVSARRWFVGGSAQLRTLVTSTLRDYGVSTYALPEDRPGGELGFLYDKAPSFHIIDHVIYHSTLDTPALVPAGGIAAAGRAFAHIIDGVNAMSLAELRAPARPGS